jgi:hypothetical protein
LHFTTHQEPGQSTSTLHHRKGEIEEDLATSTRLQETPKRYKNITESNSFDRMLNQQKKVQQTC